MKRYISLILVLTLVFTSVVLVSAKDYAFENGGKIFIDNVLMDFEYTVAESDGVNWLPLKAMCEFLQYDFHYDKNDETVNVTPRENCKNSERIAERIVFTVGSESIKMYSEEYENTIKSVYADIDDVYYPISVNSGGDIYIPAFYFARAFDLKLKRNSALNPNVVELYTRNYMKAEFEKSQIIVREKDKSMIIDDVEVVLSLSPYINESGRIMVPVREFCGLLNYSIMWFDEPGRVAISLMPAVLDKSQGSAGGDSLWFVIGEKRYRINGEYYDSDSAAQIVDNTAYVPLRILAEFLGYTVSYVPILPSGE